MSELKPEQFNYSDPEVLSNPYAFYEAIRNAGRVYREPKSGAYFITRYEDVEHAFQHPEMFSSQRRGILKSNDPEIEAIQAKGFPHSVSLTAIDPPEHSRFRSLANKAFTPRRFADMEPRIRQHTNGLVDKFIGRGKADLYKEFALPLPLMVIADVLGLDHADIPNLKKWSDAFTDQIAAQSNPLPRKRLLECHQAVADMQLYLSDVIKKREVSPGDDAISALLAANKVAPVPASHAELVDMLRIFVVGGNETTIGTIGTMMYRLLEKPEHYQRLLQDRSLIDHVIEESLRFESPAQWILRTTQKEVELGGTKIPAGASVCLMIGSANRDERKFGADACQFKVDRPKNSGHIAFGKGPHFCAGAPLSRLEIKVALETLLDRLKDLRLAPGNPVDFISHPIFRSVTRLDVEFTPG